MSSILIKVKSLPALIKKRKSSQKLEKLCDSIYKTPPPRPRNWLFVEHCQLLEDLANYFIVLHREEKEEKVWYWANDVDEEYPVTYQLDSTSMVSDALLFHQPSEPSSTVCLTIDQQSDLTRHFKHYRAPRRV
jgi:hypothetical protein